MQDKSCHWLMETEWPLPEVDGQFGRVAMTGCPYEARMIMDEKFQGRMPFGLFPERHMAYPLAGICLKMRHFILYLRELSVATRIGGQ